MAPDGEDNSRVRSGRLFTHSPVKFGRPMRPIHCGEVSAWKGNSANFAITELSEVRTIPWLSMWRPPTVCLSGRERNKLPACRTQAHERMREACLGHPVGLSFKDPEPEWGLYYASEDWACPRSPGWT